MKKVLFSLLMAGGLLMASSVDASAQKNHEVQGKAVAKSRGASNPNIKQDAPTTDAVTKKGSKSRGACAVVFDSYSDLYIKCYVDGRYRGTIEPWGKLTVVVGDGYTTVYAISAGGTREWSDSGNCTDQIATYKLR